MRFVLAACLLLTACSTQEPAQWRGDLQLKGRVVDVEDGDTLTLHGTVSGARWRIRLSDIDSPETAHGVDRPGQARGREAGALLSRLALEKTVTADCFEGDRYGRLVCHIHLPDGRLAHRELLAAGLAWPAERKVWMRDPESPGLAETARSARRGLWADTGAIPPWQWRRQCWAAPKDTTACPNPE
jgi:endonuclease YncB( thermonuclease family)